MRINVSLVLSLIANGVDKAEILDEYPAFEAEDIKQCLNYAACIAGDGLYSIT